MNCAQLYWDGNLAHMWNTADIHGIKWDRDKYFEKGQHIKSHFYSEIAKKN